MPFLSVEFFTQTMAILACFFQPTKRKSYQNWVDHRPLPLFSRWWKEMAIWVGFVSYCTCKSPILLSWLVGHILGNLVSKRNAWPSSTIYWWLIASKCRAKCRRYQMPLWLKMVDIALLISGQDCRGFALQQNIQEFLANLCICRVYRIYLCIYFLHTHIQAFNFHFSKNSPKTTPLICWLARSVRSRYLRPSNNGAPEATPRSYSRFFGGGNRWIPKKLHTTTTVLGIEMILSTQKKVITSLPAASFLPRNIRWMQHRYLEIEACHRLSLYDNFAIYSQWRSPNPND